MLRLARRPSRRLGALVTIFCGALAPSPSPAQQLDARESEGARIEEVRFEGVEALSASQLADALATKETRCRSPLYYPFCALFDSDVFEERHYLDAEELERDELRARVFYWLRGYRGAQVETAVEPDGDAVAVTFRVAEGAPTVVRSVEVREAVPLLTEREIEQAELPETGAPLNTIELDSARVHLLDRLWARGYADAAVRDSVVVEEGGAARVELIVEPGRPATVGEIEVSGNESVSERTVLRTLDLRPGELFRRDDLTAGQRRLMQSELFRLALVNVRAGADTAKRVLVTVEEAPPRAVELGVGLSTLEFAQAQARFTRFNWLGGARRLELQASVGNLFASQLEGWRVFGNAVPRGIVEVDDAFLEPTWQLSAELAQPFFLNARNSLGVGVFAHRRSVPGIVIDRGIGANASFTRRLTEGVNASATYRLESTRVEAGDVYYCVNFGVCRPETIDVLRGSQRLSPFGLSLVADRMNDPLAPTGGFTARLAAEHASAATVSDFRYNRVNAEATRYLRLGPGVLAGRVRAGWVRAVGSPEALGLGEVAGDILHPRTRFYAGGARSVRGFGENQLGPRILTVDAATLLEAPEEGGAGCTAAAVAAGSCDPEPVASDEFQPRPLGGNQVVEGNLEYRLPLWGPITGVVFLDGATVGDRELNIPSGARTAITPGFGVRYISPIGPVRVDLGIRPTLAEELPVVTSTPGEDGRARLVQLAPTKRYDPLEDSSGFLGEVLSRLQLHLSIGEAF